MSGRRSRSMAYALVAGLLLTACGQGVFRDPLGARDGGTGGGVGRDGSSGDGSIRPQLSGAWAPCGTMGTGGPQRVTLSGDGTVVAFLFRQGQVAVHRVADQALLREIAHTSGTAADYYDLVGAPPWQSPAFYLSHDLALSFDGSLVGVTDGSHVAVWRVSDGALLADIEGMYNGIRFAPDGRTFLVERELRSATDGHLVHSFPETVRQPLGFGAGGEQVLSFTGSALQRYSADETGALLGTTAAMVGPGAGAAAFSRSGRYLAGLEMSPQDANASQLFVLRTADGSRVPIALTPSANTDPSYGGPVFSPDESAMLITHFGYPEQALVNLQTGVVTSLSPSLGTPYTYAPNAFAVPIGDGAIGMGGAPLFMTDPTGAFWSAHPLDGPSFEAFPTLSGQHLPFVAIAASPDGNWLATVSANKVPNLDPSLAPHWTNLALWNIGQRRAEPLLGPPLARSVAFSPNSARVLITGWKGWGSGSAVQEWPLGATAPTWNLDDGGCGAWYFPSQGNMVAVGLVDGIGLAAIGDATVSASIAVGRSCPAMAFSPADGGETLATSGPMLWRLADKKRLWPSPPPPPPQPSNGFRDDWIAFSPDGSILLVSNFESALPPPFYDIPAPPPGERATFTHSTRLYRTSDGTLIRDISDGALARRAVFSPDGNWILSGEVLWSVQSEGEVHLPLSNFWEEPLLSTFMPDGTIAVARENGLIDLFCPK